MFCQKSSLWPVHLRWPCTAALGVLSSYASPCTRRRLWSMRGDKKTDTLNNIYVNTYWIFAMWQPLCWAFMCIWQSYGRFPTTLAKGHFQYLNITWNPNGTSWELTEWLTNSAGRVNIWEQSKGREIRNCAPRKQNIIQAPWWQLHGPGQYRWKIIESKETAPSKWKNSLRSSQCVCSMQVPTSKYFEHHSCKDLNYSKGSFSKQWENGVVGPLPIIQREMNEVEFLPHQMEWRFKCWKIKAIEVWRKSC